jgi:hypothetical protein
MTEIAPGRTRTCDPRLRSRRGTAHGKGSATPQQARRRGRREARRLVAVVNARYDAARDVVELVFRSGKVVAISRVLLPGLERARVSTLKAVSISPARDVISWRARDVDLSVRGLLKRTKASRASMMRRESRISPRLAKP